MVRVPLNLLRPTGSLGLPACLADRQAALDTAYEMYRGHTDAMYLASRAALSFIEDGTSRLPTLPVGDSRTPRNALQLSRRIPTLKESGLIGNQDNALVKQTDLDRLRDFVCKKDKRLEEAFDTLIDDLLYLDKRHFFEGVEHIVKDIEPFVDQRTYYVVTIGDEIMDGLSSKWMWYSWLQPKVHKNPKDVLTVREAVNFQFDPQTKVVIVDDWMLKGTQMETALRNLRANSSLHSDQIMVGVVASTSSRYHYLRDDLGIGQVSALFRLPEIGVTNWQTEIKRQYDASYYSVRLTKEMARLLDGTELRATGPSYKGWSAYSPVFSWHKIPDRFPNLLTRPFDPRNRWPRVVPDIRPPYRR